jgi:hypothetical protein
VLRGVAGGCNQVHAGVGGGAGPRCTRVRPSPPAAAHARETQLAHANPCIAPSMAGWGQPPGPRSHLLPSRAPVQEGQGRRPQLGARARRHGRAAGGGPPCPRHRRRWEMCAGPALQTARVGAMRGRCWPRTSAGCCRRRGRVEPRRREAAARRR